MSRRNSSPAPTILDQDLPDKEATCPAHGPYRSRLWGSMPLAKVFPNRQTDRTWTGCPECSIQHFRAKRGGPLPDLAEPHRIEG